MDSKQADILLDKLKSGDFSVEEEQQIRAFIDQYNKDGDSGLTEADFAEAKSQIWEGIQQTGLPKVKRMPIFRIAVAAAVALVIFGAGLFYFTSDNKKQDSTRIAHVIQPGKTGATLTLANGKQIKLTDVSNGELAKEAGVVITKSKNGELVYKVIAGAEESNNLNTLSTANGQTYQIHLPDGSLVHLNAASSLTYRTALMEDGKRVVELKGEGYFEVAKNREKPFIVKTTDQEVEVLGTHFNVNAYAEERGVRTTLLEGSVKVNNATILKPGQQSVFYDRHIQVATVDTDAETAWKNGRLNLGGRDFKSIMRAIARWYDVEIVYSYDPGDLHLSGGISRFENISDVLDLLQETGEVKFKVQGRRITVIK